MATVIAAVLVLLAGLYLIGLAVLCIVAPERGARFLGGFASSAATHVVELALRLAVGIAILAYSPYMVLAAFFKAFGWVLVVTSLGLLVIPWRWHQQVARATVPLVTRHLRLFAVGSFAFGTILGLSVLLG